ncbi:NAD(P)H-dependent oxidoreductase subunit E, partial [Rhizobium ruizarguesonis]
AEDLLKHLETARAIRKGDTTPDGLFTLSSVECLGACELAPVMQVGDDYHGALDVARIGALLDNRRAKTERVESIEPSARPQGE